MSICYRCRADKPDTEFHHKGIKRSAVCQPCYDIYYAPMALPPEERKAKDRQREKEHRDRAIARNREHIKALLQASKCVQCPETDWRVLDFDHLPGTDKKAAVTRLVNDGFGLERIQEEIAKCQILCVKCHRLITIERGGYWRQ